MKRVWQWLDSWTPGQVVFLLIIVAVLVITNLMTCHQMQTYCEQLQEQPQ